MAQRELVELAIDVELPHLLRVAWRSLGQLSAVQCRVEVELIEAVHLRKMGLDNAAIGGERAPDRARAIRLREEHGIPRHVGDDLTMALSRWLARRVDLHDEMPDAAVRTELDLGVPYANEREPVDLIGCFRVALARHVLDGDGVVAEARDEPVVVSGPSGTAGEYQQSAHNAVRDPMARDVFVPMRHGTSRRRCGLSAI